MEVFPFTDAEWDPLKPLADSICEASLADDDALAASLRLDMLDLLAALRERYGDHPVLLETIADYTKDDDTAEGAALYRQAIEIAEAHGLPTLGIRLALSFTLMLLGEPASALDELGVCGGKAACANEDERTQWLEKLGWAPIYAEDDVERAALYRRAMQIAAAHGQPTLDLRLAFARLLLDIGEIRAAQEELRACKSEVPGANEDERTWWAGLLEEASQAKPGVAPDHD